ncbi:MAG: hypothetical protein WCV91_06220 [Candidatus Margulisiibacteriota bacterium]
MDVGKVGGSQKSLSIRSAPDIMDNLKGQFEAVTNRMRPIAGMEGVYTINPDPPQTLASLMIEPRKI